MLTALPGPFIVRPHQSSLFPKQQGLPIPFTLGLPRRCITARLSETQGRRIPLSTRGRRGLCPPHLTQCLPRVLSGVLVPSLCSVFLPLLPTFCPSLWKPSSWIKQQSYSLSLLLSPPCLLKPGLSLRLLCLLQGSAGEIMVFLFSKDNSRHHPLPPRWKPLSLDYATLSLLVPAAMSSDLLLTSLFFFNAFVLTQSFFFMPSYPSAP